MQTTAQAWLVLRAHALGDRPRHRRRAADAARRCVLGPYGGLIADRMDKRKLMVGLQSLMGVQALVLGVLTLTGHVTFSTSASSPWCSASTTASRTRRARRSCWRWSARTNLRNAVSLNSTLVNAARAVGPAVAGVLIATVGEGWCFLLNARQLRRGRLLADEHGPLAAAPEPCRRARSKGQLRDGFRYVARTPELGVPLLMMGARRDARLRVPGDAARTRPSTSSTAARRRSG